MLSEIDEIGRMFSRDEIVQVRFGIVRSTIKAELFQHFKEAVVELAGGL